MKLDQNLSNLVSVIGDHVDDAILITDAEPINEPGPKIVWCNNAFTQMTGYTLEEIVGQNPRILQGPDSDRATLDRLRKSLENWETTRVEIINYTKTGAPFWVEFIVKPIADENGWFRYWVSVQRETTGRKERELLLSNTTQMLDNAPIGLGLLDTEQNLTYANPFLEKLFFDQDTPPVLPLPYQRWVQRGLEAGFIEEGANDPMEWLRYHSRSILSGNMRVEHRLNGVWHEFSRLVMADGTALLLVAQVEDRHKLQEQLNHSLRLESMGQLTGGIAHDFNNILAVVLGNLELTKALPDHSDKDKFIEEAIDAVLRASDLTKRLLSFARRSHVEPEKVSVSTELGEAAKMIARTVSQSISIELELSAHNDRIVIDKNLLQNAVLNLAINARDAMPEGGTLIIKSQCVLGDKIGQKYGFDEPDANFVEISVEDTGYGIPADMVQQIFEPFFTTKPTGEGSGLGLSMVHGFVKQSGGYITIDSEHGRGTCVSLVFPCDTEQDDVKAPINTLEPKEKFDASILLVDDDASILRFMSTILTSAGCRVKQVGSGDEAISTLQTSPVFDLVITDLVMAGAAQGTDVINYVNEHHPTIPTLLMSGNPHDANESVADKALLKPVRRKDLLSRMAELL